MTLPSAIRQQAVLLRAYDAQGMQSRSHLVNSNLALRRWVIGLLLAALMLQGFAAQVSALNGQRAHVHSGLGGAVLQAVLHPLLAVAAWLPHHGHARDSDPHAHGSEHAGDRGASHGAAHDRAHALGLPHHHDATEADVITLDDTGADTGTGSAGAFLALMPTAGLQWAGCRAREFADAPAVALWRDHLRAPPHTPPRRG